MTTPLKSFKWHLNQNTILNAVAFTLYVLLVVYTLGVLRQFWKKKQEKLTKFIEKFEL